MMDFKPEQYTKSNYFVYKLDELKKAIEKGTILEGLVFKCDNKTLELTIELGNNIIGYIPLEEFEYSLSDKALKSIAVISKVGKTIHFKAISYTENDDKIRVKLSRKLAQQDCYENYISKLEVGQIINARVTSIENYGMFCDIGCGIISLLPIENVCTTHIVEPKKQFKGIKNIKAVVKSIDNGKIIISHKELIGTWTEEASRFKTGEIINGIVQSVEDYGTFIEITPNLVGLADCKQDLHSGDVVSVCIHSIMPDKMKVKLSVISISDSKCIMRFRYNLPKESIIKHWVYSPECCERIVETVF